MAEWQGEAESRERSPDRPDQPEASVPRQAGCTQGTWGQGCRKGYSSSSPSHPTQSGWFSFFLSPHYTPQLSQVIYGVTSFSAVQVFTF